MGIRFLNWDSDFFGLEVYEVTGESLSQSTTSDLVSKGCDVAYILASPNDLLANESAKQIGAIKYDQRTTLCGEVLQRNRTIVPLLDKDEFSISVFEGSEPTPELYDLNLVSGTLSRFNKDPRFSGWAYKKLYDKWIHKCVTEKESHYVLTCTSQSGDLVGFFAIQTDIPSSTGVVVLFAVDTKYRGRGIALNLAEAAFQIFEAKQLQYFRVVTQGDNQGSKGIWEKFGYRVCDMINVYHLWLK